MTGTVGSRTRTRLVHTRHTGGVEESVSPRPALPLAVDRAHLVDPAERDWYRITRYAPAADVAGLARRYWIPVWSIPEGRQAEQRVLQYPVCLLVVADRYARWYGVTSGLSRTILEGTGWAFGLMMAPAAGYLLTGRAVREHTDRYVDLAELAGVDGVALTTAVREVIAPDPTAATRHEQAMRLVEAALRPVLPIDAEGDQVNALVDLVESTPQLRTVDDLCGRVGLSERSLQRLLAKRVGISPRWLIRRQRLHEGSLRLQSGQVELAALAYELGYADQAHFTRDFRAATGLTPGRFAGRFVDGFA
ncbi:MAG: helix-turn-helix transcriptional regulator [Austwickia sp.]|nr:helix-turn-helix transcriptional regulator [Austwickia sp.]